MSADEFIEQYGKIELMKMMKAQQSLDELDDFKFYSGRDSERGTRTSRGSRSPLDQGNVGKIMTRNSRSGNAD